MSGYKKDPSIVHYREPDGNDSLFGRELESSDKWSWGAGGGLGLGLPELGRFFAGVRAFDVPGVLAVINLYPDVVAARDEQTGGTALHVAAAYDCREIVRLLVNTGRCDFLAEDNAGRTPAAVARRLGTDPVISRLLARKEAQQRRTQLQPES